MRAAWDSTGDPDAVPFDDSTGERRESRRRPWPLMRGRSMMSPAGCASAVNAGRQVSVTWASLVATPGAPGARNVEPSRMTAAAPPSSSRRFCRRRGPRFRCTFRSGAPAAGTTHRRRPSPPWIWPSHPAARPAAARLGVHERRRAVHHPQRSRNRHADLLAAQASSRSRGAATRGGIPATRWDGRSCSPPSRMGMAARAVGQDEPGLLPWAMRSVC